MKASLPIRPLEQSPTRAKCHGYSLVEVLVACVLFAIGLAAAGVMAHNVVRAAQPVPRVAHALNLQEQIARLYTLDLTEAEIRSIIPEWTTNTPTPPEGAIGLNFTISTNVYDGVGPLERADITIRFRAGEDNDGSPAIRSHEVTTFRPTLR